MKKKLFSSLSTLAIAAVLVLNVTVVLDDGAASYLEFGVIGNIFASGSGGTLYSHVTDCTASDPNTGQSAPGCQENCDDLSGISCGGWVICYYSSSPCN